MLSLSVQSAGLLGNNFQPMGVMYLGTARLSLRLWWSSISKQGVYGIVGGATEAKDKKLVAVAVEGLARIFLDFHARAILPRVEHRLTRIESPC